jgi:Putative metallopeptidase
MLAMRIAGIDVPTHISSAIGLWPNVFERSLHLRAAKSLRSNAGQCDTYNCAREIAGAGRSGAANRGMAIIAALLGVLLFGGEAIRAQPTPPSPSFQARVEAAARALQSDHRLKNLTEPQRIARVEFVVGNTLFWLLHEMGHVFISELRLPVLGREEDAADTFAVLVMLKIGTKFSQRVLSDSAKGWFLSDRRDQQTGAKLLFYDEHNLSQQRAYQIVCLMVGSDPEKFKDLANDTKLPESRQESCKRDYAKGSWAWETVLAPHRRAPDQPEIEIEVTYGDGKGRFDAYAETFRSIRLLETVAEHAKAEYALPSPFALEAQSCGYPGAFWDDETRKVTLCYELSFDFAELYRAYVPPAPTAIAKKRKPK